MIEAPTLLHIEVACKLCLKLAGVAAATVSLTKGLPIEGPGMEAEAEKIKAMIEAAGDRVQGNRPEPMVESWEDMRLYLLATLRATVAYLEMEGTP